MLGNINMKDNLSRLNLKHLDIFINDLKIDSRLLDNLFGSMQPIKNKTFDIQIEDDLNFM